MNVVNEAKIDDLMVNLDLAKQMAKEPTDLHIIKGTTGYRVRVDTPDGWRIVNYKAPGTMRNLETLLGIDVQEDAGVFRATVPGERISAKATSRPLAVALAALKINTAPGVLSVVL